jgi:hypothetical protein
LREFAYFYTLQNERYQLCFHKRYQQVGDQKIEEFFGNVQKKLSKEVKSKELFS